MPACQGLELVLAPCQADQLPDLVFDQRRRQGVDRVDGGDLLPQLLAHLLR